MKINVAERAAAISLLSGWTNIFQGGFAAAVVESRLSVDAACTTVSEMAPKLFPARLHGDKNPFCCLTSSLKTLHSTGRRSGSSSSAHPIVLSFTRLPRAGSSMCSQAFHKLLVSFRNGFFDANLSLGLLLCCCFFAHEDCDNPGQTPQ